MLDEKISQKRTYRTIDSITGPLIFVKDTQGVSYSEIVLIEDPSGEKRTGQVLEVSEDLAIIQSFEGTRGLDTSATTVRFLGETIKLSVSQDMIGRVFSGSGKPIDGAPPILPEDRVEIHGAPINPYARDFPREFI
ncbi:MAG: V-type ATP synthase subunit B, partial [Promethearchaeota archaeon]